MADPGRFSVDPDELDEIIADMERCESDLERALNDLTHRLKALHEVWQGEAGEAQRATQAHWEAAMADMRDALSQIRASARDAHGNYTLAVQDNINMWRQLG